ncbi:BON domain-containing protein [Streptomyces sp. NBC_00582]|uniref:BON domain-containing protein n=1 Tax=Streptomyces sp. NBC_00582 TaxID=2975783 RepID=UPI001062D9EC|nr:BON domain-containing protein [Streptomyces sp. NBC_00582]WUB61085.1 BON domain-containing protein [Streptomyces sp. NBC_00582]
MNTAMNLEYRVAHVAERLAVGPCGELGVRAEIRGGSVLLTGTVPSAGCRDDIRRIAGEELADVPVHCDIAVAGTAPPDHPEELT